MTRCLVLIELSAGTSNAIYKCWSPIKMAEIQTFKYDWREPDRLLNRAVGKSSDGQNFIGRDDDHQA